MMTWPGRPAVSAASARMPGSTSRSSALARAVLPARRRQPAAACPGNESITPAGGHSTSAGPRFRHGPRRQANSAWSELHTVPVVTLNRADTSSAPALLIAIKRELPGTVMTEGSGDWFVFYDSDGITVPERRFPFITIVTGDRYDAASRLNRDA